MIKLSNGYEFEFVGASGALGFDGRGWPLPKYWILRFFLKKYHFLITPIIKTLTLYPKKGSYHAVYDGKAHDGRAYVVNAVGLKNPGFEAWAERYLPYLDRNVIISVTGDSVAEIRDLADQLRQKVRWSPRSRGRFIQGIEFNCSCPNTKKKWAVKEISKAVSILRLMTRLPIGVKIDYHQKNDFKRIAKATSDVAEWLSFNSVPWELVFPGIESPLKKKYGVSGAVSGESIRDINKKMALEIKEIGVKTPIVASSIGWQPNMALAHLDILESLKWADAVSFGSLFRKHPTWPLRLAKNYFMEEGR